MNDQEDYEQDRMTRLSHSEYLPWGYEEDYGDEG